MFGSSSPARTRCVWRGVSRSYASLTPLCHYLHRQNSPLRSTPVQNRGSLARRLIPMESIASPSPRNATPLYGMRQLTVRTLPRVSPASIHPPPGCGGRVHGDRTLSTSGRVRADTCRSIHWRAPGPSGVWGINRWEHAAWWWYGHDQGAHTPMRVSDQMGAGARSGASPRMTATRACGHGC